jgi:hypothetical protein
LFRKVIKNAEDWISHNQVVKSSEIKKVPSLCIKLPKMIPIHEPKVPPLLLKIPKTARDPPKVVAQFKLKADIRTKIVSEHKFPKTQSTKPSKKPK